MQHGNEKQKRTSQKMLNFRNGNITKSVKESVTDYFLVFKKEKDQRGSGGGSPQRNFVLFCTKFACVRLVKS